MRGPVQDNTEGQVWGGSSEPCFVPFQTRAFLVIRNKCKRSFVICFLIEHLKKFSASTPRTDAIAVLD